MYNCNNKMGNKKRFKYNSLVGSGSLGNVKQFLYNMHNVNRQGRTVSRAAPPLARHSPIKSQKPLNVVAKVQESPKVINFEDRLKSIITSVLNEDQEQRKASRLEPRQAVANQAYANGYVRPVAVTSGTHGTHGAYAARPAASAAPPAVAPYARGLRDVRDVRDTRDVRDARDVRDVRELRRDRFNFDRREPRPHPHHEARPPDVRHHHSAQPDYTQVSPAKLALRRHLSQERLAAPGARTIGDLVNGEIERTLEISNQSIINATVHMSARYHEPAAAHQPLEGLAACLQARVLASEYWRGRNGPAPAGDQQEEAGRRRSPAPEPHSNTSTPLVDEPSEHRPTERPSPAAGPRQDRQDRQDDRQDAEAGEEVEESKWQDRIAFRFDQIISFASTAMDDKRRRSDEACNTSPDSGIGHGEAARGAAETVPAAPPGEPASAPPVAEPAPSPPAPHHFKKRFFRRERWGAWSGTPPPAAVDWERP